MSKGLEALKELREYWLNHLPLSVKDGLRIVKVLEKEVKTLDIIKEKRVNIDYLRNCKSLEDYNNILIKDWQLTQEEYDLLKGVLL